MRKVFAVWAEEVLYREPSFVFQESTEDFDGSQMIQIFGHKYHVVVLFLSPEDLGYWSHRPRKFSFMVHKERFVFIGDVATFAKMFFRARAPVAEGGCMYWCAPLVAEREARSLEANRQHVVLSDDEASDWEECLPLGDRKRLLKYRADDYEQQLEQCASDLVEGRISEEQLPQVLASIESDHYIYNVRHNSGEKGSSKTKAMPTLLRTSRIYSSQHKRLLLGGEKLQVQGPLIHLSLSLYIYIYIYIIYVFREI